MENPLDWAGWKAARSRGKAMGTSNIVNAATTIALAAFMFAVPLRGNSADYPVDEVGVLDGKILCLAHHNLIITESSGPCDGFTPPLKVAVGQSFVANGERRTIGVVRATQVDKDFKDIGIDIKKGEWYCVAGQTVADLDVEHNSSALWLYIPRCQPISQTVGIIQPVTVADFSKLPEDIQAIYVGGLIEGMAFRSQLPGMG
jgi:hypothetical protein